MTEQGFWNPVTKHRIVIEIEVPDLPGVNFMDYWPVIKDSIPTTVQGGNVHLWLDSDEYFEKVRADEREKAAVRVEQAGEEWTHPSPVFARVIGPTIAMIYRHAAGVIRGTE